MSQLEMFIKQVKEFLGIPEDPVPIRIESEENVEPRRRSRDEMRRR